MPTDTFQWGEGIGRLLTGGEVIGLIGPLGAGKTEWVKGLAKGLGISDRQIISPTFTLVCVHPARIPLCHIDLYRLEGDGDIDTIGLSEYVDESLESGGVVAIEWADKLNDSVTADGITLTVEIRYLKGDQREMRMTTTHPGLLSSMDQIGDHIGKI